MAGMGYREYDRMLDFLKSSQKARKLFMTAQTVIIAYDPVQDTIMFIDQQSDEHLEVKV